MSRMGTRYLELSESADYHDGRLDQRRRCWAPARRTGDALEAYRLGWREEEHETAQQRQRGAA